MKFLLLAAVMTLASLSLPLTSAFASTRIIYPEGQSAETIAEQLGITMSFYDRLVVNQIAELSASGECGLGEAEKLLGVTQMSQEDSAQEEIQYHTLDFNFENVTFSIGLIEISGSRDPYESVEYIETKCKTHL